MILVKSGNYKIPCAIEQSMYIPEQACTSSPHPPPPGSIHRQLR